MAKIIAISNHKGGVGKTTTCYNLGAVMAESGIKVLMIDLDPQANLTLAAGYDPEEVNPTIVDLIHGEKNSGISSNYLDTPCQNMKLIPGDPRMAQVEKAFYDQDDYETNLVNLLDPFQTHFDAILMDCPPTIGAITLAALSAAQTVLIPVQCEYYAARGLHLLIDVIGAVRERTNPGLMWYLLGSMFDARNNIHKRVLNQLEHTFPNQLLSTVIRMDTKLRECPLVGEPVIHYAPKTRASEQFRQLGKEFIEKVKI